MFFFFVVMAEGLNVAQCVHIEGIHISVVTFSDSLSNQVSAVSEQW